LLPQAQNIKKEAIVYYENGMENTYFVAISTILDNVYLDNIQACRASCRNVGFGIGRAISDTLFNCSLYCVIYKVVNKEKKIVLFILY
jgi:hypothetical protein